MKPSEKPGVQQRAAKLFADLPDNGDHAQIPFSGPGDGHYTLYAYREFRGKGFPKYTFYPPKLTAETPRELTGRLIIGCIRHLLGNPLVFAPDMKVTQIRKVLPKSWTPEQMMRVATHIIQASYDEDLRQAEIVTIRKNCGLMPEAQVQELIDRCKSEGVNIDYMTMTLQEALFLRGVTDMTVKMNETMCAKG